MYLQETNTITAAATAATTAFAKQLASRPALEALQQQGIVLPESLSSDHAAAAAKLEASLAHRDQTDAVWRAKPDQLSGGHRCVTLYNFNHLNFS
jgi:hypothetical protein